MRKWLLAAAGVVLAGASHGADPATKPETGPKPRLVKEIHLTPQTAGPDFGIQGEYEGEANLGEAKPRKFGLQLVARGEGKFVGEFYQGGLPGAGWDGKKPMAIKAERTGVGKATVRSEKGPVIGELTGGVIKFTGAAPITFKRVERKSPTLGKKPPEGAVVLYGGPDDVNKWNGGKVVKLPDGAFLGVGETSKQAFGNFTMHLEFRLPYMPLSGGQGRANSGVFLQNRYEVQVLDSFGLKGENNECGGLYSFKAPDVNMCLPPLVWQTYDVEFRAAEFGPDGKKLKPAVLTLYHNGVKIHDAVELKGPLPGGDPENNKPGVFQLQNHGDPVVFRNIWVMEKRN